MPNWSYAGLKSKLELIGEMKWIESLFHQSWTEDVSCFLFNSLIAQNELQVGQTRQEASAHQ